MSRPTISLLPLEEKDLAAAGDLLHTCKLALPINRLLINGWPNPSVQKPMYHGAIKESFDNPDVIVEKAVDNVKGDLIGFVVFTRKRPSTSDQKDETPNQAPETPPGLNPRVFQTISKTDVELRSSTSKVDHYELIYVAVDAAYRRQGIASQLLSKLLNQSKEDGVPIITAAEPEAHPFFVAKGFEETGKVVEWDLAQWAAPKAGFGVFRFAQIIWKPS